MKKLLSLITLCLVLQQSIIAQCTVGSYTVSTNAVINSSCVINGDLTILNGATLNVDFTSAKADTFVVRGNILLKGNGILWVHSTPGSNGDQFIVSNSFSGQRAIVTQDSSHMVLDHIEFRTQEGNLSNAASIYMNYTAQGHSLFYNNSSWLNRQTAWLLCNLQNKSTLVGYGPDGVPTEIYLNDTAQMALHGPKTNTGIWLNCESVTGTMNLPPDQSQPFTWKIGRGAGGFPSQWYLEMDTVKAGVGVEIFSSSKVIINGSGLPMTGELKVALFFANSTDTLKNLKVGLQNTTVTDGANGKVTLNNVNLGPIAWQVYALMNEALHIKKSVVNEIGIMGPSNVTVDSCLLQLAVLAAVGVGGSTMTVNNSEIWNQAITASNNSTITLNNCNVTGSAFSTTDAPSRIKVNGGCFFKNPAGCTMSNALNIITGQPSCNPFIPPGFPQILTPAAVTLTGVNNNCSPMFVESITDNSEQVIIYPNPGNGLFTVENTKEKIKNVEVYNVLGEKIPIVPIAIGIGTQLQNVSQFDISGSAKGIYFVKIITETKIVGQKIVVQ